jgi:mRNA-degrading endonuclease toxin of MazEF toxin-antitoxin module
MLYCVGLVRKTLQGRRKDRRGRVIHPPHFLARAPDAPGPLTSREKGYPFEVVIVDDSAHKSVVLADQVESLKNCSC